MELENQWSKLRNKDKSSYETQAEREQDRYSKEIQQWEQAVSKIQKPVLKPICLKHTRSQRHGGRGGRSGRGRGRTPALSPSGRGRSPCKGSQQLNLFNKVVTVDNKTLAGKHDYFFILTYIPDLQWCRVAPLVQKGVFGKSCGKRYRHFFLFIFVTIL